MIIMVSSLLMAAASLAQHSPATTTSFPEQSRTDQEAEVDINPNEGRY